MAKVSIILLATYHPHYKKIARIRKSTYGCCIFWPTFELSSLLNISSDYKDKIVKLLYSIKVGNNNLLFIIYTIKTKL